MKITFLASIFFMVLMLQTCASEKNGDVTEETFWVSGIEMECDAGAGKANCLLIYRDKHPNDAHKEYFYAPIEGFDFEEGSLQRIKVKVEKLDKENVPADASNLKYTLVEVIEKRVDTRALLQGDWELKKLNDAPLDDGIKTPAMTFDLAKKKVSGNNGCNNYTASIDKLTAQIISLGNIATTRKICPDLNIGSEHDFALNSIATYKIKGNQLTFYDDKGKKVLSFAKQEDDQSAADAKINDIWVAARIKGNPIDRMSKTPRLEVNLAEKRVTGTDGCNDFTTMITGISENELSLSMPSSTQKACRNMEVADAFRSAFMETKTYEVKEGSLTLYDEKGKEVLFFLKTD